MTEQDLFSGPSVSFVLPSYNEEANIERAIEQTRAVAVRLCSQWEILVVDDGSTDRTAEIVRCASASEPSIKLISHSCNRGYGEALRSGFAAAQFEFVFFTDADNQFDMNDLELLMVWVDRADVVAGYRKVRRDTFIRQVNAWGWNRLVRMLFYVPVRDIDCAFKLFRREVLQQIDIQSRGAMINTEIMVKLARSGCLIVEVGVNHFPRIAGAPQGAKLRVIARALREVRKMYPHLSGLAPQAENAALACGAVEPGPAEAEPELDTLAIAQERWGTSVPGARIESANGHAGLVLAEELGRRTGSSTR
jgi:glycosyltransferase involved in cell wall biosynthesis